MDEKQISWVGYTVLLLITALVLLSFITKATNDEIYKEKIVAANLGLLYDVANVKEIDVKLFLNEPVNYLLVSESKDCNLYANFGEKDISKNYFSKFPCFYFRDDEVKHINSTKVEIIRGELNGRH